MTLVKAVGLQWPRNEENFEDLEDRQGHDSGIYLLYHGAMPVYIGKGKLVTRLRAHHRERSGKAKYWDRFSWFVINHRAHEAELEGMLLQALPFYVRALNKQTAKFPRKIRQMHLREHQQIPYVALPKLPPAKKGRR